MVKKYYLYFLSLAFLSTWIWSWWSAADPHNWLLENELVFFFVPIVIAVFLSVGLSRRSLTCITLFLALHIIGSHYNYGSVPFGLTVGNTFGIHQNEYDKLVHFAFGLLIFYPIRELYLRFKGRDDFWSYAIPFNVILCWSALYEIDEWFHVANLDPHLGYLFIGGNDPFDTQKDMAMAGIGALVALIILAVIHARRDKDFWRKMRESFMLK